MTPARDMIDINTVGFFNAPDVRGWPQTAAITAVKFDGGTTAVDFTKKNGAPEIWVDDYRRDPSQRWPNQPTGGPVGDNFQYTLWLFLNTPGVGWVGSAFVQFWFGRPASGANDKPENHDVPSRFHINWFYDRRWGALFQHGPIAEGETIGFMVTPGNGRNNAPPLEIEERSNIVTFPAHDVVAYEFPAEAPGEPGGPVDPPVDPGAPPPAGTVTLATIHADLQEIIGLIKAVV